MYKRQVSCLKGKVLNINESELKNIDSEVLKMVSDFYHKDEKGFYGIPYRGINANDISFYMNTSNKPNVSFKGSSKCSMVEFFSLKPIKKGGKISKSNVKRIRPGFGLAPKYESEIIGRKVKRDVEIGEPVKWEIIC